MNTTLTPNTIKTAFLLGVLTVLLLYFGQKWAGPAGFIFALFLAICMNFGAYWFADKIVLSLYDAKPTVVEDYPALYGIVAYLVEKADLPSPKIYVIEDKAPNAFAIGRDPLHAAIVVTTGLLKILSKDELAGVIAHEIAHIQQHDTLVATIAASIGGALSIVANVTQWAFIFVSGRGSDEKSGRNILGTMLMSMVAPLLAILIQIAISRSREYAADEEGANLCGQPMWLADALRKIHNAKERYALKEADQNPATAHLFIVDPLRSKQWMILFSTHPPIAERIDRLEALIL